MSRMPDEGDSTRPDDRVNNGVRRAVEIDAANNCASRSAAPLLNHFTITTAGDAPRCHPARSLSLSRFFQRVASVHNDIADENRAWSSQYKSAALLRNSDTLRDSIRRPS